jgi:glutamate synthase domain-containing protein 2
MLQAIIVGVIIVLLVVAVADQLQTRHAVRRNFPLIGNLRYMLESVGPELRQYIVTGNDEDRPFSRNQRRWVYASAKGENNKFGFGTDVDIEQTTGHLIIKHAAFPHRRPVTHEQDPAVPCGKVLGAASGRAKAFRPASVVNVSAMSFGSLGGRAVEAMNGGAAACGCLHNTGEGGLSPYHRHGGELIFQIGTGYFGCRDADGSFSLPMLKEAVESAPVRAIEIKLSQGAKPGLGGMLPAAKVNAEIAAARGVPVGREVMSPSTHREFSDVDSMLDFIEMVADATGLPVGIKSAVGETAFWEQLADQVAASGRQPDFITLDGGEGGTGAAPLVQTDHVALPYFHAQARVQPVFVERDIADRIVFIGSGKLGFPQTALLAFALGADMVNVGREAMMAVGCIQAQKCHNGKCPTGVATHSRWRQHGLDVGDKTRRLASYVRVLRSELLNLARTCGECHPSLVTTDHFEVLEGSVSLSAVDVYGYAPEWGLPGPTVRREIATMMDELEASWAAA